MNFRFLLACWYNFTMHTKTAGKLSIPIAVIIAGALVGAALFLSRGGQNRGGAADVFSALSGQNKGSETLPPVTASDHLLGNPEAPIIIVEYSDTECPFCKQFHATMHRIMDSYGREGSVAWVYRHFPIAGLHPHAEKEAEAAECAAELGGSEAFWNYIDRIYAITPSNDGLDPSLLPHIAFDVGLDRTLFKECLASGRHTDAVRQQIADAQAAGGTGTPWSFILSKGNVLPVEGAQPYAALREVIEALIQE